MEGEQPQPEKMEGAYHLFKTIKDAAESPLGKIGLKVLEKELGVSAGEKEMVKKGFGRSLLSLEHFLQGTWWIFIALSLFLMLILILYLWLRARLGI